MHPAFLLEKPCCNTATIANYNSSLAQQQQQQQQQNNNNLRTMKAISEMNEEVSFEGNQ